MFLASKIHNHTISETEIHFIFFISHFFQENKTKHIHTQQNCNQVMPAILSYHESSEDRLTVSDTWGLPVDSTRQMGDLHLIHHLEQTQNCCFSKKHRLGCWIHPLEQRMAGNKGITFAVAWGMTYAARKLKNYFPGSFFLLQNTGAILVLTPTSKRMPPNRF